MRYLGIDYGSKRIGIALSDSQGHLAFPYGVVGRIEDVFAVIRKENVSKVIVGLPIPLRGRESSETKAVRRFAAKLKHALRLPIEFESEMFTTKIAERYTAKEKADASAAALILQSYLDKQKQL